MELCSPVDLPNCLNGCRYCIFGRDEEDDFVRGEVSVQENCVRGAGSFGSVSLTLNYETLAELELILGFQDKMLAWTHLRIGKCRNSTVENQGLRVKPSVECRR